MRASMMPGKDRPVLATLAACAAGLLAACGSGAGGSGGVTSGGGSTTIGTASSSESASASGSRGANATFSCDIKPGAGLLPGQTPKPGRIVATVAGIEAAIGLSMTQSVDISMVSGLTECRYQLGNGQVDISILNDPSQAQAELAKTKSQNLALHDRSCNGCSISGFTPLAELGADGYTATNDQNPVYGGIAAGIYFEVDGVGLKAVRLERLALVIAANLASAPSPSLPPLPTPTPTS